MQERVQKKKKKKKKKEKNWSTQEKPSRAWERTDKKLNPQPSEFTMKFRLMLQKEEKRNDG